MGENRRGRRGPTSRRELKSIPQVENELLSVNPYTFTQEELLFAVRVLRQGIDEAELTACGPWPSMSGAGCWARKLKPRSRT
jgi:hypothetical protein